MHQTDTVSWSPSVSIVTTVEFASSQLSHNRPHIRESSPNENMTCVENMGKVGRVGRTERKSSTLFPNVFFWSRKKESLKSQKNLSCDTVRRFRTPVRRKSAHMSGHTISAGHNPHYV